MADLIQFDNLRAVLEEFAGEFRDTYRESLLHNDRITKDPPPSGERLADSVAMNDVKAMVQEGDRAFEVSINLRSYWKYVEEGVQGSKNPSSPYKNPGWSAYPHILNWVQIKPVIPRPSNTVKRSNRSLSSLQKSAAYMITREIAGDHPKHPTRSGKGPGGTVGSHDFRDSREAVLTRFRTRIRVAMAKDVQNYVRALLAR